MGLCVQQFHYSAVLAILFRWNVTYTYYIHTTWLYACIMYVYVCLDIHLQAYSSRRSKIKSLELPFCQPMLTYANEQYTTTNYVCLLNTIWMWHWWKAYLYVQYTDLDQEIGTTKYFQIFLFFDFQKLLLNELKAFINNRKYMETIQECYIYVHRICVAHRGWMCCAKVQS